MTDVLFVTPFIAHYRKGVFIELRRRLGPRFQTISGRDARPGNPMPVVNPSELEGTKPVRNVWIGPVLVQPALPRLVMRSGAEVHLFVGDPHHLSTWLASMILRMRRKRVLFWTIGWHRPDAGVRRLIRLAFYRLADGLLLYGEHGRRTGIQMGYPEERMRVIGNSSDVSEVPSVEEIKSGPAGRVVGAIVRTRNDKRLDLLMEAASLLARDQRPVSVVIGGTGPELSALRELARDRGIDATFLGEVYRTEDLIEAYRTIDVTVVPEALGLTAVQSLWFGTPMVTCDDPDRQMPESTAIVAGVTGDLYRVDSVASLAATIDRWLVRTRSDRLGVARACRKSAEESWSASAHASRIAAAIWELGSD